MNCNTDRPSLNCEGIVCCKNHTCNVVVSSIWRRHSHRNGRTFCFLVCFSYEIMKVTDPQRAWCTTDPHTCIPRKNDNVKVLRDLCCVDMLALRDSVHVSLLVLFVQVHGRLACLYWYVALCVSVSSCFCSNARGICSVPSKSSVPILGKKKVQKRGKRGGKGWKEKEWRGNTKGRGKWTQNHVDYQEHVDATAWNRSGLVTSGIIWSVLMWSGLVWSGLVWSDLMRSGLVWSGLVWSAMIWCDWVWSGQVWSSLIRSDVIGSGPVRSGLV